MEPERAQIFSPEYYDQLADHERHGAWAGYMRRLALALLDRHGGGQAPTRVLDAGCGAGYFTLVWRDRGRIPFAVGLDCSPDALRLSRARGLRHLAAGSVASLPFEAGSFEAVHCADVLQHLSSHQARETLREFARVLGPQGLLLIRCAARRGLGSKKHRDSLDYQQWEPEKLREHVEPTGLRIEWMSRVNWLPSLAADLSAYAGPAPAGNPGFPAARAEGGLRLALLETYWRMEALILLGLRWPLPGGHTLLCVARKS